jgi:hypothetical protein
MVVAFCCAAKVATGNPFSIVATQPTIFCNVFRMTADLMVGNIEVELN